MLTIYIMEFNKLLKNLLNINNIENFTNKLIEDRENFLKLNNIKSYNFNLKNFEGKTFDNSNSDENIVLMYRLLELKFYNLIEGESLKMLEYKDEIKGDISDNKYLVFLTNEKLYLNIFKCYLLFYFINIRFNQNKMYLGLDFEFNTKVVALMQINFEQSRKDLFKYSLIFLFHPDQLDEKWRKFFIKAILCRSNVYKILHGSDSLDIPYVYNNLLNEDVDLIIKFNEYFIDTKFLCEYNFYRKNLNLGKCKIYQLLLDEKIISPEVHKKLLKNEEDMGHIYDIVININTLNDSLINYTLYDVVFLPQLVVHFKNEIEEYSLINQLVQLSFMDKRNIININLKNEISKINNYILVFKSKNIKLYQLHNYLLDVFKKKYVIIDKIFNINYFKSTLNLILKYELFTYICNNFEVYSKISNKTKYNNDILNFKFSFYDKLKIIKLIEKFKSLVLKKIR